MITVNTSPLAQAVIGGKLLEHDHSLVTANKRQIDVYRRNRRLLLDGLAARFPDSGPFPVSWNRPSGGFFVVVDVPFTADDSALEEAARQHGVLWTPMSHFYEGTGGKRQLRLFCSVLTLHQITDGLDRLHAFVTATVAGDAT
ncbi:hypothetical protein [Streptomyces sp. NPDC052042]|uniref:hypothetical protein n=1 Tax=Streptomyces sp. NPDC052042 TaxID=3365683 RepID=UPI0037CF564C